MSESYFSHLPRFDNTETPHAGFLGHSTEDETSPAASSEETEADETADLHEEAVRKLAIIEQTMNALAELSDQVRRDAIQRTEERLTAMAEQLFPQLGRAFLAEEIARNLPDLMPASAPSVEIRAEPELAADLQHIVEQSPQLAGICHVIEDENPGPNRATVSWGDGGMDFDFASLLEACTARLKTS
ncbi:MAG: hypothetical protein RIB03_04130 [Henriciella sp.]|uniref:hypothetical protein n=1 Tax=Henriciella sp. TaxID=1968823 RepID=UPI002633A89F|nr:hypothetical protein [Henriciella sp.]